MSIVKGLKQSTDGTPEKTACICGDTRLSFQQVNDRVNKLSSALAMLGVGRTDRVAILSFNCHRFYELYYAVPQLGAVVVPINFRLQPPEIKYIVDHSGSRVVFVDPADAMTLQWVVTNRNLLSISRELFSACAID